MSIRWECHAASTFPQLAQRWDALNLEAGSLPFLDSRFLAPLLKHFGNGTQQLVIATQDGKDLAACIVEPCGLGRWHSFQPSQLPLGPWLMRPEADLDTLTAGLLRSLPGATLLLGLTQLDPLFVARPADGGRISTVDYIQTAWVDVEGSFDSYWEARGKNLRTNMRKQRSKLEADGVQIRFENIQDPAQVDTCLAEYGRLEATGWKAEAGTAVGHDNAQGAFYADMMRAFCASGQGSIWRLQFDDKTVAMDLCIESGSTLVVLKTAFDAEHRSVSPAFILRQDAFRGLFDEGRIRRIEFYGRLMEWHTRWTQHARTLYHLNTWRWGFLARLKQQLQQRRARQPEQAPESATSES